MSETDYKQLVTRLIKSLELTQKAFGDRIGVSQGTVSRWLKGQTVEADNRVAIDRLADEVFGTGADAVSRPPIAIVGMASAGGDEIAFADGQGPFGEVDAPEWATDRTVAVQIRGASLGKLLDGWLAFYDDRHDPPTEALHGRLCVCGLADGRVVLKKLLPGSRAGLYHLESSTEGTMFDRAVIWAAKVLELRPG